MRRTRSRGGRNLRLPVLVATAPVIGLARVVYAQGQSEPGSFDLSAMAQGIGGWITENAALSTVIGFMVAGFAIGTWNSLSARAKVYSAYVVLPAGFLVWSAVTGSGTLLYFLVFLLGMSTAFAEILQKFRGEPLAALATWQGLLYHLLNGAIAALALNVMLAAGVPVDTPLQKIQAVAIAGLGSMLVMRSKLFSVKVGDETIAVGPEQLINIVLGYLEHEIDRVRSVARIEFVKNKMKDLKFSAVTEYAETMLFAAQALDDGERAKLKGKIDEITANGPNSEELRSYRLGFLLLTEMGDEFVSELFANPPREWLTKAPDRTAAEVSFLPNFLQRPKYSNLFVPDDPGAREQLAERLNWSASELDGHAALSAELADAVYDPSDEETALPAFSHRRGATAKVVIYKLPQEAVDFVHGHDEEVMLEEVTAAPEAGAKAGQSMPGMAFFRGTTAQASDTAA